MSSSKTWKAWLLWIVAESAKALSLDSQILAIGPSRELLKSADYGVPQLRKRVIFFAWLSGLVEPNYPAPSLNDYVTVADAIYDLPKLKAGESTEE